MYLRYAPALVIATALLTASACGAPQLTPTPSSHSGQAVESASDLVAAAELRAHELRPEAPELGPAPAPESAVEPDAEEESSAATPQPQRTPDAARWWGLPFTFVAWPPAQAPHDPGQAGARASTVLAEAGYRLPCSIVVRLQGHGPAQVAALALKSALDGYDEHAIREFRVFGLSEDDLDLDSSSWPSFIERATYLGGTRQVVESGWGIYQLPDSAEITHLWLQILRTESDSGCALGGLRILSEEDIAPDRELPLEIERRVRLAEVDITPWQGQQLMGFPSSGSPTQMSDDEVERRLQEEQ